MFDQERNTHNKSKDDGADENTHKDFEDKTQDGAFDGVKIRYKQIQYELQQRCKDIFHITCSD